MDSSIDVSALGREVQVGNFYNYYTDAVFPIEGLNDCKPRTNPYPNLKVTYTFLSQLPDAYKRRVLGIDSHVYFSMETGSLNRSSLWFDKFLLEDYARSNGQNCDSIQYSNVYFRMIAGEHSLPDKHTARSMMDNMRKRYDGRATHLVDKVFYGIEFLCTMTRNRSKCDVKRDSIEVAVKEYFDKIIANLNQHTATETPAIPSLPKDLLNVTCAVHSSYPSQNSQNAYHYGHSYPNNSATGYNVQSMSLDAFGQLLKQYFVYARQDAEAPEGTQAPNKLKWRPVTISLLRIPARLKKRFAMEVEKRNKDNYDTLLSFKGYSQDIEFNKLIDRIPPAQQVMNQFKRVLQSLLSRVEELFEDLKRLPIELVISDIETISELLPEVSNWLFQRRVEIETFARYILDHTALRISTLENIREDRRPTMNNLTINDDSEEELQVFVLRMEYVDDPVVKSMQKASNGITATSDAEQETYRLPVFPILAMETERLEKLSSQLQDFNDDAIDVNDVSLDDDPLVNQRYYIGLFLSSSLEDDDDDGTVKIIKRNSKADVISCPSSVMALNKDDSSLAKEEISEECLKEESIGTVSDFEEEFVTIPVGNGMCTSSPFRHYSPSNDGEKSFSDQLVSLLGRNGRLKQVLDNFDIELETRLVHIENIRRFCNEAKTFKEQMGALSFSDDFSIEFAEIEYFKSNCIDGALARNCIKCVKTCDIAPKTKTNTYGLQSENKKNICNNGLCKCDIDFEHEIQNFFWEHRLVMTKKTLRGFKSYCEAMWQLKAMSDDQLLSHSIEALDLLKESLLKLLGYVCTVASRSKDSHVFANFDVCSCLALMKKRTLEEKKSNYLFRLETLEELVRKESSLMAKQISSPSTSAYKNDNGIQYHHQSKHRHPTSTKERGNIF